MRLRMRKELSRSGPKEFDIKQDAGGIGDIEFLVQYWVLAGAEAHPELLTYTDNIRQLEGLAAVGVIDAATALWLTETYISYRTVLHHLSLEGEGERVVPAGPFQETRERLRAIWHATLESAP
jgi:glutamate-ammonia-ligase adenylyltransferase